MLVKKKWVSNIKRPEYQRD